MLRRVITVCLMLLVPATGAAEALRVVATTTSMGALAREIGGERITLDVLVAPDRDAHYQKAKPSMAAALRRADLLVAVGAELEIGWLPAALSTAANPQVLPGRAGYFEAAAQVPLREAGRPANRMLGDIHPMGNPHVNMDPVLMATVGRVLAERMAELDPEGAEGYRRRAAGFADRIEARMAGWLAMVADAPGAILYHKDADYLFARLEVPVLGYVEPTPGVPPTARHIKELTDRLQGQPGVIIYAPYHSANGPRRLGQTLGWERVKLTIEPPMSADGDGYLDHIDRWVDVISNVSS